MNRLCLLATLSFLLLTGSLAAQDVKIVLWNGQDLFDVAAVDAREDDITAMAEALQPDMLLIDEVCSLAVVERVRDIVAAALDDESTKFQAYCSDFVQADGTGRNALEVGIISRFKADAVVELDPTPDNKLYDRDGEPEEMPLVVTPLLKQGLRRAGSERGVLWARFDDLQLTVCVTHLKSSLGLGGAADYDNAKKREFHRRCNGVVSAGRQAALPKSHLHDHR